jgi:hypothetical protein
LFFTISNHTVLGVRTWYVEANYWWRVEKQKENVGKGREGKGMEWKGSLTRCASCVDPLPYLQSTSIFNTGPKYAQSFNILFLGFIAQPPHTRRCVWTHTHTHIYI